MSMSNVYVNNNVNVNVYVYVCVYATVYVYVYVYVDIYVSSIFSTRDKNISCIIIGFCVIQNQNKMITYIKIVNDVSDEI